MGFLGTLIAHILDICVMAFGDKLLHPKWQQSVDLFIESWGRRSQQKGGILTASPPKANLQLALSKVLQVKASFYKGFASVTSRS